ncbi:Fur family transcriptional regulator [Nesterenkonia aurantiaca]|uniref:Fur family transcriptional regulator n=1 Tax=Nesterenkonia aurantiaca TaxID=1436010 RepID=UPI003EE4D96B
MTMPRTPQRIALAQALEQTPQFRSAQQLHAHLLQEGHEVSLATVYRHLNALAEAGALETRNLSGGETRYRQCRSSGTHHHLVCRDCGETTDVADTSVEQWVQRVGDRHHFTDIRYALELSGLCAGCQHAPTG